MLQVAAMQTLGDARSCGLLLPQTRPPQLMCAALPFSRDPHDATNPMLLLCLLYRAVARQQATLAMLVPCPRHTFPTGCKGQALPYIGQRTS